MSEGFGAADAEMANAQWPTKSQVVMTNARTNFGPWCLVLCWPLGLGHSYSEEMMCRHLLIVLFFAVLLVPVVLRRFMVHAQSSAGSGLRLVVITPDNQDIRREFAGAFDRWHREKYGIGVTIDYRTPGGTNDIERQLRSTYAVYRDHNGNLPADVPADIDILFGGGDYSFNQLKAAGLLQPMHLDPTLLRSAFPESALAGVRMYDNNVNTNGTPAPRWVGACLSGFGIIYNPDLYHSLQLPPPTTWHDLTDPRLNGFIGLADPSHSGSVGAAMMMVLQRAMADAEQEAFARERLACGDGPSGEKKERGLSGGNRPRLETGDARFDADRRQRPLFHRLGRDCSHGRFTRRGCRGDGD